METGKNQEKEDLNDEFKTHLENEHVSHDDWDNDTYGHIANPENLRKKNEPDQDHIEHVQNEAGEKSASEALKNVNLSDNDDVASRNSNNDKGIGGKSI